MLFTPHTTHHTPHTPHTNKHMRLKPEYFDNFDEPDDEGLSNKPGIKHLEGLSELPDTILKKVQLHADKCSELLSKHEMSFVIGFQSYQIQVLQKAAVQYAEGLKYLANEVDQLQNQIDNL